MDCDSCSQEKFEEVIGKPLYKEFYSAIKNLRITPKDTQDSKMLIRDFIKRVNTHREEILNFFFVTWLACQDEKNLKKEIIRSILKHETIVIAEGVTENGLQIKISFESKYNNKIGKYKGPIF